MIDTIFSLDDFLRVLRQEGGRLEDIRICVVNNRRDNLYLKSTIQVTAGIFSRSGQPRKILRCIVASRIFPYYSLYSQDENDEKERYREWTAEVYRKVEETLGFKPLEGYWSWSPGTDIDK